jgi:Transglutaminase-like superfamily
MRDWSKAIARRLAIVREVHRRGDSVLAVRSLCFALAVPGLMRLPLPKLDVLLDWASAGAANPMVDPEPIAATVLQVLDIGQPLVRRGCLTRGLTLYYCLRRAGVPVSLCFGMGRASGGDGFDGHCWLELAGQPYLESRDPRTCFASMYTFGRRGCAAPSEAAFG